MAEHVATCIADTAKPFIGKMACYHAAQVAFDLVEWGLLRVADGTSAPLLRGSKMGIKYLRRFEGVEAATVGDVRRLLLPHLSASQVQTSLCMYNKYVVMYNCGVGRWYKKPRRSCPFQKRRGKTL